MYKFMYSIQMYMYMYMCICHFPLCNKAGKLHIITSSIFAHVRIVVVLFHYRTALVISKTTPCRKRLLSKSSLRRKRLLSKSSLRLKRLLSKSSLRGILISVTFAHFYHIMEKDLLCVGHLLPSVALV